MLLTQTSHYNNNTVMLVCFLTEIPRKIMNSSQWFSRLFITFLIWLWCFLGIWGWWWWWEYRLPRWRSDQIRSDQSLSRVRLFATPWIAACQASLSNTNCRSSLRLTSTESVMPSSHLILLSPSPPAPNLSQHQSLFQWVNSLHEVAKVLEFQL